MTEENKENCNFQQTYNVFGLDDKPCCYLYHKYCEEINNCYFKRCKRLEQENKQLTQWLDEARRNADFWCDKCTSLEQENEKLHALLNSSPQASAKLKKKMNICALYWKK